MGYDDLNNNNSADDGEWDGSLTIEGTLNNTNTGYSFNADGYQDFNIRLKADLDANVITKDGAIKTKHIKITKLE